MKQPVHKIINSKMWYLISIFTFIRIYLKFSIKRCVSNTLMAGKVVIVTGANSGIGFYEAKELARRGARVILACRNKKKALRACSKIVEETGNQNVVFKELDLSSLDSVREFAKNIIDTEEYLHVLINNAGTIGVTDRHTQDGIVETMQVNYFAPFLLTLLLLPLLKKSQPSRIINLSSIGHFLGNIDLDTINAEEYFNTVKSYCNSKLAILIFTVELAKRLEGTGVVVNAVHPGIIFTHLFDGTLVRKLFLLILTVIFGRTLEQGAQTVIHLAVSNECENVTGKYFVDCSPRYMSKRAQNTVMARNLWDYSVELVRLKKRASRSYEISE